MREALGRPAQAQADFEAAIAIYRDVKDRRNEDECLGQLGLLHARQGRHDEAMRCLDAGETVLRAAADQSVLGVLLCGRAEVLYRDGDAAAANTALAEAGAIAAEFGAAPTSELGVSLARVTALINPG